jgi:integrase
MNRTLSTAACAFFQIEGTVRVGKKSVRIRETTGARDEAAATVILNQRVAEIERELLLGTDVAKAKRGVPDFATVAADYVDDNPHLGNQDRNKLVKLGEFFGETPVDHIGAEDWENFVAEILEGRAPATVRRWFAMFSPPMHRASRAYRFSLPEFTVPKEPKGREIFLEPDERDGLLETYAAHALPVAKMLCFQGCRHFEALRLTWPDVSFSRDTLTYRDTKNGDTRVVPMHHEVRAELLKLHKLRQAGRVFLTPESKPYNDRRQASHGEGPEGSGIRTAHEAALRRYTIKRLMKSQDICMHCGCSLQSDPGTKASATIQLITPYSRGGADQPDNYKLACSACDKANPAKERARVAWFRIHDWRHHWASWMVMDGGDGKSLMELGGWKTAKMVDRYVKLSVDHLRLKLNNSQRRGSRDLG